MTPEMMQSAFDMFQQSAAALTPDNPSWWELEALKIQQRDLVAQWFAAGSAFVAALAAITAGYFAARAWGSQIRQENAVLTQLGLAQNQSAHAENDRQRERRGNGPLLKSVEITGLKSARDVDQIIYNPLKQPIWGAKIGSDLVESCITKNGAILVPVKNTRKSIELVDWAARVSPAPGVDFSSVSMVRLNSYQYLDPASGRKEQVGLENVWLIELSTANKSSGGCMLEISFETESGFEDTHLFHVDFVCDQRGYIRNVRFYRQDPVAVKKETNGWLSVWDETLAALSRQRP